VIVHWADGEWSALEAVTSEALSGVTCQSVDDGWIVGDRGTILRYDGTTLVGRGLADHKVVALDSNGLSKRRVDRRGLRVDPALEWRSVV
jgi:hypothetical protein